MIGNYDRVELKNLQLEKDYNGYYLYAEYEMENKEKVDKLVIPHINLPVAEHVKPYMSFGDSPFSLAMELNIDIGFGELQPSEAVVYDPDVDKSIRGMYYVRTLKEKIQELTLSEIEKKLGCKIKIVAEKEEK